MEGTERRQIRVKKFSHNVPAVYDVLPDANKGFTKHRFRRKRDQGWKNVPEQ
jgi:hypothetical protein